MRVNPSNYFKFFCTRILKKLKLDFLLTKKNKSSKENLKPYYDELLNDHEVELDTNTLVYALLETFWLNIFFELVKMAVLPTKDILLLKLRINFVKDFDCNSFLTWMGLELLSPVIMQEIARLDYMLKKFMVKSIKNLIFKKSLKIQVQTGGCDKIESGVTKKNKGMGKIKKKNKGNSKFKTKKLFKNPINSIKSKDKSGIVDYDEQIIKNRLKTT